MKYVPTAISSVLFRVLGFATQNYSNGQAYGSQPYNTQTYGGKTLQIGHFSLHFSLTYVLLFIFIALLISGFILLLALRHRRNQQNEDGEANSGTTIRPSS